MIHNKKSEREEDFHIIHNLSGGRNIDNIESDRLRRSTAGRKLEKITCPGSKCTALSIQVVGC